MANGTVTVTTSGNQTSVSPTTLTLTNVGAGGSSTVQWTGSDCTVSSITWGNPGPPGSATLPSSSNNWTLTYPNPGSRAKWNYTIAATPDGVTIHNPAFDPEIDNDN